MMLIHTHFLLAALCIFLLVVHCVDTQATKKQTDVAAHTQALNLTFLSFSSESKTVEHDCDEIRKHYVYLDIPASGTQGELLKKIQNLSLKLKNEAGELYINQKQALTTISNLISSLTQNWERARYLFIEKDLNEAAWEIQNVISKYDAAVATASESMETARKLETGTKNNKALYIFAGLSLFALVVAIYFKIPFQGVLIAFVVIVVAFFGQSIWINFFAVGSKIRHPLLYKVHSTLDVEKTNFVKMQKSVESMRAILQIQNELIEGTSDSLTKLSEELRASVTEKSEIFTQSLAKLPITALKTKSREFVDSLRRGKHISDAEIVELDTNLDSLFALTTAAEVHLQHLLQYGYISNHEAANTFSDIFADLANGNLARSVNALNAFKSRTNVELEYINSARQFYESLIYQDQAVIESMEKVKGQLANEKFQSAMSMMKGLAGVTTSAALYLPKLLAASKAASLAGAVLHAPIATAAAAATAFIPPIAPFAGATLLSGFVAFKAYKIWNIPSAAAEQVIEQLKGVLNMCQMRQDALNGIQQQIDVLMRVVETAKDRTLTVRADVNWHPRDLDELAKKFELVKGAHILLSELYKSKATDLGYEMPTMPSLPAGPAADQSKLSESAEQA